MAPMSPAQATVTDAPASGWTARPWGRAATDLDVAFAGVPAHVATSQVLERCLADANGQPPRREALDGWSLAARLQALIAVRRADRPDAVLEAQTTCARCGARFGLGVPLAGCVDAVDESPIVWTSPDGRVLQLRLPRAADLLAGTGRGDGAAPGLPSALVESIDGAHPPAGFVVPTAWADALEGALAERDRWNALVVEAACPECGQAHAVAVDLESLLLQSLAGDQAALLDEVVRLAHAFHWPEGEIVALPPWRRADYLARIEAMEAA